MVTNVSPPLAAVALLVSVGSLTRRGYLASALALGASASFFFPALIAPRAESGMTGEARVLVFNAYAEASSYERTIALLGEIEADLVLLNECPYDFARVLDTDVAITSRFPHRDLPEHANQWARGVLSVWPMERLDLLDGEQNRARREALKFQYLARRAQLVRHPSSPFITSVTNFESPRGASRWRAGNLSMREDAELIREELLPRDPPFVLGVDMNATPAAPRSRRFSRETGLVRAKPLLAPAGTWPASAPSFLRVPIDDLFVSAGVRVVSWEVIETETNSDHAPVLVTIDLPDPEPESKSGDD